MTVLCVNNYTCTVFDSDLSLKMHLNQKYLKGKITKSKMKRKKNKTKNDEKLFGSCEEGRKAKVKYVCSVLYSSSVLYYLV